MNLTDNAVRFIRAHILDRDFYKPGYSKTVCKLAELVDNPEEYNNAVLKLSNGAAMCTQRI